MNPLTDSIDTLGLTSVWTYLAIFLAASLVMIWRLDALLKHGLEGTADPKRASAPRAHATNRTEDGADSARAPDARS